MRTIPLHKILVLLLCGVALTWVGCKNYDDDINGINNRIDKLITGQIASVEQQVASMKTSVDDLKKVSDELVAYDKTLKSEIDALTAKNTTLTSQLDELKGKVDASPAEITRLENLISANNGKIAALKSEIDALTAENATLTSKLNDLKGKVDASPAEIARLENLIAANTGKIATIDRNLKSEIATLTSLINDLKGKVDASPAEITRLENLIAANNGKITLLTGKVETLEKTTIPELNRQIGDLERSLDGYLTKDLASQTYATLEKFNLLSQLVNDINSKYIDDTKLQDAISTEAGKTLVKVGTLISDSELRMQDWFGTTLKSTLGLYFTASDKAEFGVFKAGVEECIKTALAQDGMIDTVLAQKLQDLGAKISALEVNVNQLLSRVQSMAYVPTHSDGKATVNFLAVDVSGDKVLSNGFVKMSFQVEPALVTLTVEGKNVTVTPAKAIADAWLNNPSVLSFYTENVKTRAAAAPALEIIGVEEGETDGRLVVTARPANFDESFFLAPANESYSSALCLNDKEGNKRTSEYVNMVAEKQDVTLKLIDSEKKVLDGDKNYLISYTSKATIERLKGYELGFVVDGTVKTRAELEAMGYLLGAGSVAKPVDTFSGISQADKTTFTVAGANVTLAKNDVKTIGQYVTAVHKYSIMAANGTTELFINKNTKVEITTESKQIVTNPLTYTWTAANQFDVDKAASEATLVMETHIASNNEDRYSLAQIFAKAPTIVVKDAADNDFSSLITAVAYGMDNQDKIVIKYTLKIGALTQAASPLAWGKTLTITCGFAQDNKDLSTIVGQLTLVNRPATIAHEYADAVAPIKNAATEYTYVCDKGMATLKAKADADYEYYTAATFAAKLNAVAADATHKVNGSTKTSGSGVIIDGNDLKYVLKAADITTASEYALESTYTLANGVKVVLTGKITLEMPKYTVRVVPAFMGNDANKGGYFATSKGLYTPNATKPASFSLSTIKLEDLFEVVDPATGKKVSDMAGFEFAFGFVKNSEKDDCTIDASNVLSFNFKNGDYVQIAGTLTYAGVKVADAFNVCPAFRVYADRPILRDAFQGKKVSIDANAIEGTTGTYYAFSTLSLKDRRGVELLDSKATQFSAVWITGGENLADDKTAIDVYAAGNATTMKIEFGDAKLYYDAAHTQEATSVDAATFVKGTGVITFSKANLLALQSDLYMVIPVTVTNPWSSMQNTTVEVVFTK